MALRLGINLGFVTNSSSVVYHFPAEVLKDPTVKAFIEAFELSKGFVGRNMWNRGECASFAVTREQKAEIQRGLIDNEYDAHGPAIDVDSDDVVLVYGDEYHSIVTSLAHLMKDVAGKLGLQVGGSDYN